MTLKDAQYLLAVALFLTVCTGLAALLLPLDVAAQSEPVVSKQARVTATLHGRLVDLTRIMTQETPAPADVEGPVPVPLGLDTNDRLHVVLWRADAREVEGLMKHVGHDVVIEGVVYTRRGVSAVLVETITRIDKG